MKKAGIPILLLGSMFMVAIALPIRVLPLPPRRHLPPRLRPLCASQITLVNYACGTVPLFPPPPSSFLSSDTSDTGNGTESSSSSQGDGDGDRDRDRDGDEDGTERHNRNRHRRRQKRERRHVEITPEQVYCCRWLRMVEVDCVCDMLTHMPLFMSWPLHHYTVMVEDACSVTFSCGGRLRL